MKWFHNPSSNSGIRQGTGYFKVCRTKVFNNDCLEVGETTLVRKAVAGNSGTLMSVEKERKLVPVTEWLHRLYGLWMLHKCWITHLRNYTHGVDMIILHCVIVWKFQEWRKIRRVSYIHFKFHFWVFSVCVFCAKRQLLFPWAGAPLE